MSLRTIQDQTSQEAQPVAKREPQRGRGRGGRGRGSRIGDVVEGVTEGIGGVADGIFVGQTIQDQTSQEAQPAAKREPQRGRGRGGRGRGSRVGGVVEGVSEGIGGAADAIFIGQTIQDQTSQEPQPVAKREPQRGRGRGGRGRGSRVGGVIEGVGEAIGVGADGIFIGQTIQDQTSQEAQPVAKREAQRGQERGGLGRAGICQVGVESPCNGDSTGPDLELGVDLDFRGADF
ncbi:hypothetical protein BKA66DRAFT_577575 [Pyrenochaeta sp. MPI-SDFR-AT-0127]|nr:hypothetical protein BKA66DRAFT_577575 [Pyrenochaeta sp. MPI-SDFR-AT-0127]